MTMVLSEKILLSIVLANFAGIFLWVGICLHLAYTKMDVMLEHFKNSPAITSWLPMRQGGPWGKLLLIGGISGLVTFPNYQLKRGQLSVDDLASIPPALKRKLVRLQRSAIGLVVVMVTFGIAVKLDLI